MSEQIKYESKKEYTSTEKQKARNWKAMPLTRMRRDKSIFRKQGFLIRSETLDLGNEIYQAENCVSWLRL